MRRNLPSRSLQGLSLGPHGVGMSELMETKEVGNATSRRSESKDPKVVRVLSSWIVTNLLDLFREPCFESQQNFTSKEEIQKFHIICRL
jgi:hypothetical protein